MPMPSAAWRPRQRPNQRHWARPIDGRHALAEGALALHQPHAQPGTGGGRYQSPSMQRRNGRHLMAFGGGRRRCCRGPGQAVARLGVLGRARPLSPTGALPGWDEGGQGRERAVAVAVAVAVVVWAREAPVAEAASRAMLPSPALHVGGGCPLASRARCRAEARAARAASRRRLPRRGAVFRGQAPSSASRRRPPQAGAVLREQAPSSAGRRRLARARNKAVLSDAACPGSHGCPVAKTAFDPSLHRWLAINRLL